MPTYEYQCEACDHQFELFQTITSRAVRKCPSCGKLKVRRLIGPGSGIIFRGSGFYQTDYRSEDYKRRARADSGSDSGGSKSPSKKPESKGDSGDGSTKKAKE